MDKAVAVEAAKQAADSLAQAQLWSSVIIGVVAIGVPAAFAVLDRLAKRSDSRLRARSFALTHMNELELILESLNNHVSKNPRGESVTDHSALNAALIAFRDARLPVSDLYLLDTAAKPVQQAFAEARRALSYWFRRQSLATAGEDIVLRDAEQSGWMHDAHTHLTDGMERIRSLLF